MPEQILALLACPRRARAHDGFSRSADRAEIGEILGLRWRDVDFNSGEIRVEQACYRGLIGTPKTKNSRRILPMPDSLKDELKHLREKASIGRASGFSDPQWHPVQRYQPAASTFEAGWQETGDALAQLAHAAPNSRHAFSASGRNAQRSTSAVRSLEDVNHPRNLHDLDSASAAQGSRKSFGFGDQW